jgi:C_GCAxxG_C_C family probable redox protein
MLAVGEHLLGDVDDRTLRMTTGMGGGMGLTLQELCGALSSGILLIGAIHGRISPEEDDSTCARLAAKYRENFLQAFGTTRCEEIRDSGYGSEGKWPCSELVERAAGILLKVLNEGDCNRAS